MLPRHSNELSPQSLNPLRLPENFTLSQQESGHEKDRLTGTSLQRKSRGVFQYGRHVVEELPKFLRENAALYSACVAGVIAEE